MNGKDAGANERVEGNRYGKQEGRDNGRKHFPRLRRFPAPKARWDERREPLVSGIAEGRGRRGGEPSERAGLMVLSTVSHGCSPPPERRRRCYARRWARINAIKGVDPEQWDPWAGRIGG